MVRVSGTTLTDWLRAQDDQMLVALLRARPDLATPPPSDTGVLAGRAATRASVARASENLDTFTLTVLEALLVAGADTGRVARADVAALVGADVPATSLAAAVDRLRALALVWGSDDELAIVPAARETGGPFPGGLGKRSPALEGVDVDRLLTEVAEGDRRMLTALAHGQPVGRTRDAAADVPLDQALTPAQRLLAMGLLARLDDQTVELPMQVGLALRGDTPLGAVTVAEPGLRTVRNKAQTVDATGAGEALDLVRRMENLLLLWSDEPPQVLKSGGLGVRELRRLARAVDADERQTTLLAELAVGAALVGETENAKPEWVPTSQADVWLVSSAAHRWATLAAAWLDLPRLPGLAGLRDAKDKLLVALSDDLRRPPAPTERVRVLTVLAELPPGTGVADPDDIAALLTWRAPRRGGRLRDEIVRWTLAEATAIGLVAIGALTGPGRALLDEGTAIAAKRMLDAMPDPIDHVLVQADLTVVAPGPLQADLAAEIALVADVESAGSATVYRISEASIRRALDAGRTATELHELFRARSRTPVPQSLSYLIDDIARRHGRLRGGASSSFLRCDDEALIAEVSASAVATRLELRRIAPTVAGQPAPAGRGARRAAGGRVRPGRRGTRRRGAGPAAARQAHPGPGQGDQKARPAASGQRRPAARPRARPARERPGGEHPARPNRVTGRGQGCRHVGDHRAAARGDRPRPQRVDRVRRLARRRRAARGEPAAGRRWRPRRT